MNHDHIPSPPRSSQPLWPYPLKGKQEKKKNPFSLCCPYTQWSMVKLPTASPLKKTQVLPYPPLPEAIVMESYTSAIFIPIFKISRQ